MVDFLQLTPEVLYNWKQTFIEVNKKNEYCFSRLLDATSVPQLESKLWIVESLLHLQRTPWKHSPKKVALLGGWYAHYITQLLIDNFNIDIVHNFEIDEDVKKISYKFNKRYKETEQYQCSIKDVMFKPLKRPENPNFPLEPNYQFDTVINTSCEHMFPMTKFYELNHKYIRPLYVLQSTNDDQYDDHINCVSSSEELAEQNHITDIYYSGEKRLQSGMLRFMVIGYPDDHY